MNDDEYTAIIRSMIQHEDRLQHQRMTWLLVTQAFLLAAVRWSWDDHEFLVAVICILGLVLAISIAWIFRLGQFAIRKLLVRFSKRVQSGGDHYVDHHIGPPPIGSWGIHPAGYCLAPWNLLPWLIAAMWLVIGVVRYCKP